MSNEQTTPPAAPASTEVAPWQPPPQSALPEKSRPDVDGWIAVVRPVAWLAEQIAATDFVPKGYRNRPAAVTAAILHGRELGLAPITALAITDVIDGHPSMRAEGLRALVLQAGHEISWGEMSGGSVTCRGRRKGTQEWTEVTWTLAMAQAAGLAAKDNWRKHPRQMLQARASSELCKILFPDVCHGLDSLEEVLDEGAPEGGEITAEPAPSTSVSRAPRTARKASRALPAPGEAQGPPISSRPTPAGDEIPLPETPGPSAPSDDDGGAERGAPGDEQDSGGELPADLAQAAQEAPERPEPAEIVHMPERRASKAQITMIAARMSTLGVKDDDDRRAMVSALVGRELAGGSTKDLTASEASGLINRLAPLKDLPELDELVQQSVEALERKSTEEGEQ